MSEFPLHPNDDDLRDDRVDALLYAIGLLTITVGIKRTQAAKHLPGTVADALEREALACERRARVLIDLMREIERAS